MIVQRAWRGRRFPLGVVGDIGRGAIAAGRHGLVLHQFLVAVPRSVPCFSGFSRRPAAGVKDAYFLLFLRLNEGRHRPLASSLAFLLNAAAATKW